MAETTAKKRNITKTKKPTIEEKEIPEEKSFEEIVESIAVEPKKAKKFDPTDGIPCESITSGELGIIGLKSNINYRWANRGDVTEVEAQDLIAAIRSSKDAVMRPRFIIRDEDFVEQYPQVNEVYKNLYSIKDMKDILRMPVNQMEATIASLPKGAKESIEGLAATMIRNGQLDSVKTIKKLDEIFGVKFSLLADM